MTYNIWKKKYKEQRYSAKQRGIPFLLTLEQWRKIWITSGHWHQRGCRKGQYVMARIQDRGGYVIGNVKIVGQEVNHYEGPPPPVNNILPPVMKGSEHPNSKLDEPIVRWIRKYHHRYTARALASYYGVTEQCLSSVINGDTWKHVK